MSKVSTHPLTRASLTYYIFEGVLVGQAAGKLVHMFAHSGGGGGYKEAARKKKANLEPIEHSTINNPYRIAQKTGAGHRGGPIPPGRYVIKTPTTRPTASGHFNGVLHAELAPDSHNAMYLRGGFYIHGRGPNGSDGCIVPLRHEDFQTLMEALKADGGGILYVQETSDGDRFV